MTPTLTYACETKTEKTEKSCCEKGDSEKDHKECCNQNHSKKNKNNDGYDGKCENSSCHCATINLTFALPFCWGDTKTKNYFVESKKTKNYHNENYLSEGFVFIWVPPNLG